MAKIKDLSGMHFGELSVVEQRGCNKHSKALWYCTCSCGNSIITLGASLIQGMTQSCGKGCYISTKQKQAHKKQTGVPNPYTLKHGMSKDQYHLPSIYRRWQNMKTRCDNPNSKDYYLYGGRGISYDPSWKNFKSFYDDMGDVPEGLTLDRVDTNANYSKDNCRWATWSEQRLNQRRMHGTLSKTCSL